MQKRRGRPPKQMQEYNVNVPSGVVVRNTHPCGIETSAGVLAHGDEARIPLAEYDAICQGDIERRRLPRLKLI